MFNIGNTLNFFRFCFKCGNNYHAPTDCDTIKRLNLTQALILSPWKFLKKISPRWLTKCADDSETANYISAHTKVAWFRSIVTTDVISVIQSFFTCVGFFRFYHKLFSGLPKVQHLYREERWMQPHAGDLFSTFSVSQILLKMNSWFFCSVTTANMIFAGCALGTGGATGASTTSAQDIKWDMEGLILNRLEKYLIWSLWCIFLRRIQT